MGCVRNEKQIRWSLHGWQQWTSPQDGSKSFVALDDGGEVASSFSEKSRVTGSTSSQVSKPLEKVAADAVGEIERLQAAIAALGDSTTLVKPLQESLRVAQTRASVPPIQERVDSCKLFLERAKKRVQRAQEVIDKACEQKVLYEAEVVEGEERLAKLVAEAANIQSPPVVAPQVSELQARIDALVVERDALRSGHGIPVPAPAQGAWMGCGPPRFEDIPIPTSGAQDLAAWMSQQNCELRNAIEFVAKIGGLLGQSASVLSTVGSGLPEGQTDIADDEIRSREHQAKDDSHPIEEFKRRTMWFKRGSGGRGKSPKSSEARGSWCH